MDFKTSNEEEPQIESNIENGLEHEKAPVNKLVMSLLAVMLIFLFVMGVMIFNNLNGDSLKTNIVNEEQQVQQEQNLNPVPAENRTPPPLSQEEIDALLNEPATTEDKAEDPAAEQVKPLTQEEIDALLNKSSGQ